MSKLEEVFARIQDAKREMREIKRMYRDALSSSKSYENAVDELKGLREKKKKIEENIKSEMSKDFNKFDHLKASVDNDQELMSDIAVTKLSKGELIKLIDKNNVEYEPIFRVNFKKMN